MGEVVVQRPEDITAAFLGEVLGRPVEDFDAQPVGTGQMADSVRYTLKPGGDPASVVVKFAAADETSRATGLALRSYEIEVRFYKELAQTVGIRTPRCYYASVDPATGWFTLVLEDMAPAEQGDQMAGCSIDQRVARAGGVGEVARAALGRRRTDQARVVPPGRLGRGHAR